MDKFFKLLNMELLKIVKRKSTYIILGILVILSIANPILEKLVGQIDYDFDSQYLDTVINYEKSENVKLNKDEKIVSDIKLEIYCIEKNMLSLEKNLNLDKLTYLYQNYNEYREAYYDKLVLDYINKYGLENVTKAFESLEYYVPFEYVEANYKFLLKDEKVWKENYKEVEEKFNQAEETLNNSKDNIKFVESKIEYYENSLKENNDFLKEVNDKDEKNRINALNKAYEYDLDILNYTKQLIISKDKEFDINYLKLCIDLIELNDSYYIESYSKMTEKEFILSLSPEDKNIMTYEKYLKIFDLNLESQKQEIQKKEYALKNNLYDSAYDSENVGRSLVKSGYSTGTIFILISVMISIIIAKEFTTGSIRLLMIRPVKRWKILFSKLLAILIMTLIMTIIAYLSLLISCLIIYGIDILNIPNLEIINSKVEEQSIFIQSVNYTLLTLISTFSLICIAVTLAVFSRSPAATIAGSLAIYFGSMLFNMEMVYTPQFWMQYTIIPYINFMNFSDNIISNIIMQNNIKYGLDITIERGIITFVVLSLVLLIISTIRFNKMDIKNT